MEGPSLVILNEELMPFIGKKVLKVLGNTNQPKENLLHSTLKEIETWGKVIFLIFTPRNKKQDIITKTHFLLFGSYRINEPKENRFPRLELTFKNGTVYFYSCSIQFDGQDYYNQVDRKVDLLSPDWDEEHVVDLLKKHQEDYLCDLLLDQKIFAGSGNIIKNEVLFNIRRHPHTRLSEIRPKDWIQIAWAVRDYCFNFYLWKKNYELRRHWQVYKKVKCPVCGTKLIKEKTGKMKRRTFYCPVCQDEGKDLKVLTVFDVLPVKPSRKKENRIDH